jgi:hypothetical protein
MAKSSSHKFGQDLGRLLEEIVLNDILKPRLLEFTEIKNYLRLQIRITHGRDQQC